MSSDLIFIISRQRSGSTVFRKLLETSGAFNAGEIMHGDISKPHRFYKFVGDRILTNLKFASPQTHANLFNAYIEELRKKAEGGKIAIDLKYFGLNLIPSSGDLVGSRPHLLKFIAHRKVSVVHIIRKNKLRVLISELMAKSTGKWSITKERERPGNRQRLVLDLPETLRMLETLENQDKKAEALLAPFSNQNKLVYETLFEKGGNFSSDVIECVQQLLECKQVDPVPKNLRMNPENLAELIENQEELVRSLRNTRYAWMTDED